jgi:hypothetical protein
MGSNGNFIKVPDARCISADIAATRLETDIQRRDKRDSLPNTASLRV